jgi:hypothetical protein
VIVEGRVENETWAEIVRHLCEFRRTHPDQSDVRLRAIHQGVASSVLYVEADRELSLAAYLAEFADISGKGSIELFEKLAAVVPSGNHSEAPASASVHSQPAGALRFNGSQSAPPFAAAVETTTDALQRTEFWEREKAFVILTSKREIWFEAASDEGLTLRAPRGSVAGLDIIGGRFVLDNYPIASSSGAK